MKRRLSRGEIRYALMLVGILVLAAFATRTTMSHLQDLVYAVEYEAETRSLLDYLDYDKSTLLSAAEAHYAAATHEEIAKLLNEGVADIAALLSPEAELITFIHADRRPISYTDLQPNALDWPGLLASTEEASVDGGWVGYAKSSIGPVMIAVYRRSVADNYAIAMRPLDRVYVSSMRNVISACAGFQPFWALDRPDADRYVHVEDYEGKRIGSFVMQPHLSAADTAVRTISLTLFAQTLGFLFLAGALGLGAIRVIATLEGRRRVAEFVNDLSYLSDGVIVTDRHGRITGANPAARELASMPIELGTDRLREIFSFLTVEDMTLLMDRAIPHEVEHSVTRDTHVRMVRLRSQPLSDVHLFLISDVTSENIRQQQGRQLAQLQLIGRIARGVAHDFNNILCAISGHASLLTPKDATADEKESYDTIQREADRGAALARQLLELSRIGTKEEPCENVAEHVEKAADLLRIAIRSSCHVTAQVTGRFPTVRLSGIQLEQIVVNLGLLCADELTKDGHLSIDLHTPTEMPPYAAESGTAAVIVIAAHEQEHYAAMHQLRPEAGELGDDLGVIYSVVRSIVSESGGSIERLVGPQPISCFRVALQQLDPSDTSHLAFAEISDDMKAFVKAWRVLVGIPEGPYRENVASSLRDVGMHVELANDLVSCLAKVQSDDPFNGIVVAQSLLGHESSGLVQAIMKLKPQAGIVVMTEDTPTVSEASEQSVVYESMKDSPETVLNMLIRASQLALERTRD